MYSQQNMHIKAAEEARGTEHGLQSSHVRHTLEVIKVIKLESQKLRKLPQSYFFPFSSTFMTG